MYTGGTKRTRERVRFSALNTPLSSVEVNKQADNSNAQIEKKKEEITEKLPD